jgi:hypothetical protein
VPALIFDLDGTLVDTVYAHASRGSGPLAEAGMPIDGWRIHRCIGMSSGLFTRAVGRELGRPVAAHEAEEIQLRHGELFREPCRSGVLCPVPSSSSRSCDERASRTGSPRPAAGPRSTPRSTRSASGRRRSWSSAGSSRARSPSRISSWPAPIDWTSPSRSATSSAMRCGTCSPRGARGCSASARSAALRRGRARARRRVPRLRDTRELRESLDQLGVVR